MALFKLKRYPAVIGVKLEFHSVTKWTLLALMPVKKLIGLMESRKPLQNYHLELEFFDFVTKTEQKVKLQIFFPLPYIEKGFLIRKVIERT